MNDCRDLFGFSGAAHRNFIGHRSDLLRRQLIEKFVTHRTLASFRKKSSPSKSSPRDSIAIAPIAPSSS